MVNPADQLGLTEAIVRLYCAPALRTQLGMAAAPRRRSEFPPERMELGYRALYERLWKA